MPEHASRSTGARPCRNMASTGVPIKLLHEGEGHAVVVELKNGELYRGHLDQVRAVWAFYSSL